VTLAFLAWAQLACDKAVTDSSSHIRPSTSSSSSSEPAKAQKSLPEGFVPLEGTGIHSSGWPTEIRCLKDDSVMVFVPAGEFQSGLDDDQVEVLAKLIAAYDTSAAETARRDRQLFLGELKPGKLLTAEDLKDLDKRNGDVACALMLLGWLQESGADVPHQDLAQWRNEGRTLDSLLAIPMVHDLLREAAVEMVQDLSRYPETVHWLLTWSESEPQPGNLLTEADLHELDKQEADGRAVIAVLDALQRESADIPAEDLKRWRNAGRTLAGLLAIPAVREGLLQWELRMLKDAVALPVEVICRELRERFPKARKVRTGAFYIDKYEVTNRQYRRFFEQANDPDRRPGFGYGYTGRIAAPPPKFYDLWSDSERNADDQPVTCVGRKDALTYAKWAGKQVPTQQQWERAAVGDGNRLFPWGDDFTQDICKCGVKSPEAKAESAPALDRVCESATRMLETERKSVKVWEALRIAANLPAAARELRTTLRKLPELTRTAVPATVGAFPKDVSPFGCFDLGGNVSERAILAEDTVGEPTFEAMGGNAESRTFQEICPAVKEGYERPGKLLGLRTIVSVEPAKE